MPNDDVSKTAAHGIPLPGKLVNASKAVTGGTENVPWGTWVEVKQGQVVAPDTYVDDEGVLRTTVDDSTVVWHDVIKGVHCQRRGIKPEEIVYDPETNAPWCPECWAKRLEKKKAEVGLGPFCSTCGGDRGKRDPADSDGLGCLENIYHFEEISAEDDLGMTLWG